MKNALNTRGFTLIEIVMSLIILGVLGTLIGQHYFDLRKDAEEKLAKATVDAAQVKINSRFTRYMAQGDTCAIAVSKVEELSLISDDGANQFGEFNFQIEGNNSIISPDGVRITATSISSNQAYSGSDFTLEVPACLDMKHEIEPIPDDENQSTPAEDFNIDGLMSWSDNKGDNDIHLGTGLFFNEGGSNKLYIWVHSSNGNMTGKDFDKVLEDNKNNKYVVEINLSEAVYATQQEDGQWNPALSTGSLKKEGEDVSVYIDKNNWVPVYAYVKEGDSWLKVRVASESKNYLKSE